MRGDQVDGAKDSIESVPHEFRADWEEYLDRTVEDLWARPILTPRDRSILTIGALATLRCPIELKNQMRRARAIGLSRIEVGEILFQVLGYAGMGVALEAMAVLAEVFAEEGGPGITPDAHSWPSQEGRHDRSLGTLYKMAPEHAETMFEMAPPYIPYAAGERAPFSEPGAWMSWLHDNAFGDLWCRPHLSDTDRERVVTAVLIALARQKELKPHLRTNFRFGFTYEEVSESIVHLAVYVGFPTAVEAIMLAREVVGEMTEAGETVPRASD
jgi:4-carboxymuconolactone decarboxylase